MNATTAKEHVRFVSAALRTAASTEITGRTVEVTEDDPAVHLRTSSDDGRSFRVTVRGDLFEIWFDEQYVYTTFMTDVAKELEATAREALREIGLVCKEPARMVETRTRWRKRPMLLLATLGGEVWPFYLST